MTDILIVEDNMELSHLLRDFLCAEGYTVSIADSGEKALSIFESQRVKLVILDIMLPGMDGFAVCQEIRKFHDTTIIIVSAKTGKDEKLNGLILGADDYIEKPYDIDILLAKIKGIFKRRYAVDVIKIADLKIDRVRRVAYKGDKILDLRAKEFELLLLLAENQGKVLSKEKIFSQIWGFDSESELQTLTVHIKWLREKIEEDAKHPVHIITVWGVGYRFE